MRSDKRKEKKPEHRKKQSGSPRRRSKAGSSPVSDRKPGIHAADNAWSSRQENEPQFRTLFETMTDGVLFHDPEGRIIFANPAAERLLGLSLEEMHNRTLLDPIWQPIKEDGSVFPAEENPPIKALRTGKAVNGVIMGVRHTPAGGYRWISINAIPASHPGEKDTYQVYTIFSDITERKRYEETLKESEKKYRTIFERASDSIVLINEKTGEFVEFNNRAYQILGYTREEFARLTTNETEAQQTADEILKHRDINKKRGIDIFETKHRAKNGKTLNMLLSVTTLNIGNNNFILSIGHDITERKEAEEKIKHLNLTLRAIRNINQLIIQEKDRGRLLKRIVQCLTETRGYSNAWIVLTDESGAPLIHAESGVGEDFTPVLGQWQAGTIPVCGQKTLGQPGVVLTEKPALSCAGCPLSDKVSCNSSMTTRLEHAGKVYGLLNASIPGAFITDEELSLFKELAADCAFALYSIDLEEKRARAEEALRESELKYRAIFERASDSIVLINEKTGEFAYFNDKACQDLDYSREEFAKLKVSDIEAAESADEIKRHFKKIIKEGPDIFETKHKTRNGEIRNFLVSVTSLDIGDNKFILSVGHDITERKQAEKTLRESEDKYRAIFERASDSIVLINEKTGEFADFNDRACRNLGYSREEFARLRVNDIDVIESADEIRIHSEKSIRGIDIFETKHKTKSGEIRDILVSFTTLNINDNSFVMAIWHDITERKQAEEALRESEARIHAIRNSIPDIIITMDEEGRYADILTGSDDSFYMERREIIGRLMSDVLPKDIAETSLAAIRQALGTNTTRTIEYELTLPSGKRWFEGKISPVLSAGKKEKLVVMVARDITEQKKLKEEQQRIERLESLGILAGGIAHDFNNILTGIVGNISLARRDVGIKSKAADKLEEAEKASLRARDLTYRLLTFARGGAPVKKTISLTEVIRESADFALRGSNVRCTYSLPDSLWPVEADEGQINQVFTNLVINACEAMPRGGVVDISAGNITITKSPSALPTGKYVEITVADHGTGISKENLKRIFEPYFTTKQKGSGLGLATTYSIIKSHGGHINVESEPEAGTTFRIYLRSSEKSLTEKKEISQELPVASKGRILVMDDEEAIRLLLSKILTKTGYEVDLAQDGEEAIKKYSEAMKNGEPFAAVIMDLTIPGGMGGKDAIRELQGIDVNVKAIVSSGYSTDPIMADYREYGFSGVVAKPYQAGEIEKTLRDILLSQTE